MKSCIIIIALMLILSNSKSNAQTVTQEIGKVSFIKSQILLDI